MKGLQFYGNAILSFIQSQPVVNLFLILGTGVVVGKIKIGNIDIGSVTGVLCTHQIVANNQQICLQLVNRLKFLE